MTLLAVQPAGASPWWWATFSIGDGGSLNGNTSTERYIAQFIRSAQNQDTVYMASFTWGSGNHEPLNGIGGTSTGWGINALFNSRVGVNGAAPVRIIADGDDLVDINATKSPAVPMRASPQNTGSATHNKVITLGARAVMTGSTNFTAGAYSNQPNNMVILRVPSVAQAFLTEMDDQFVNSNFIENTPSPQNLFTSPNGDRIEVFFAPDDNGNINLAPYNPNSALKDVLKYRIANINESVFYMINQFGMTTELSGSLAAVSSSTKIVEGWFDQDPQSNKAALQGDHTARDWGAQYNVQGHHKVMIFDMEIVATGSANHSYGSMRNTGGSANIENMVLIHDFRLGRKYMQEYRRAMSIVAAENVGAADSFEQVQPGAVTGLAAVDVAGTSNQLQVSWTGPNNSDLSRYYVFISPTAITAQRDIGDMLDNDNDKYFDEDPLGDVDGFQSGTTVGTLSSNDDDADGSVNEDPWMFPEVQVKNQSANASVSTTLSSVNVGDLLQDNTNYWVAVVAVDKHGNEGPVSIVGPVQSLPAQPGALPAASVAFSAAASNVVATASSLDLSVGNASSAVRPITSVTVDLGTTGNFEQASATQSAPTNWTVSVNGNSLTFNATTNPAYIDPGETLVFTIAVTNASNTGPTTSLTVAATDNNSVTIGNINAGSVTVVAPIAPPPPGATNNVTAVSATDGANTIINFSGAAKLDKTNVTVSYTLANAPNTGTSIWWDVNKDPDGPGGSATDRQVTGAGSGVNFTAIIPGATDAAVVDSVEIRFLVQIDGETHTNGGAFYRFLIDDTVTMPAGLAVQTTSFNSLTIGWNAITDADFSMYELFYSPNTSVTLSDPSIQITTQSQTGVVVSGLSLNTTYYFAILSRDLIGNVSGLSPQISGTTKQGTNVTVNNVTDGTSYLPQSQLDGTGLLTDNPFTISFTIDKLPASASEVQVWYDVGNNPDGPGGANSEDRQLFASGSGYTWQVVIPASDAEIVNQAVVQFVFVIGGQLIHFSGVPYAYRVVNTITQAPTNLTINDTTGVGFSFHWDPISIQSNFQGYRLYYATDTVTLASLSWDWDDDGALYFASASNTVMDILAPGTQYKFKAAGVDRLGNVGPLSNEAVGTTGTKGALLISEVGIEENPEYIEVEAYTGPIDISSYQVTDLDVAPITLAGSALTLSRGQRAVIWNAAGTDETDAVGDANGNGYRDIYAAGWSLPTTTDEMVILSANGDTVDAVVYRGTKLNDFDTSDVVKLTPADWKGTDSSGAVRAFTTVAYQKTPAISRKRTVTGSKLADNGKGTDWEVGTDTTPGAGNAFMSHQGVSISDTSPSGAVIAAVSLAGSDKLKGGPYRLKLTLSQVPVMQGGLKFWYDTGVDPNGRSVSPSTDAPISITIPSLGRVVDTDISIPEATHGKEIRFIFTSENDPTNPDAQDEIVMTRGGASYRFTVDLLGPDTPTALRVTDRFLGALKLTWTPINNPGDFSAYIMYYDTAAVTTASKSWTVSNDPNLSNVGLSSTQVGGLLSNIYYNFRLAAVDALGNISGLSDTASETTVAPVTINVLTATDGFNLVTDFGGTARLRQTNETITVTFDRPVTSPVLYWNTNPAAPADGPGGNGDSTIAMTFLTSNQYKVILPALSNDSQVFFVFNTDAGVVRRSDGAAFSFRIDGTAGDSVSNFKFGGYFDVGPNRNTSIAVTWTPLPAATYPDFQEYRIYFKQGDQVSAATGTLWGVSRSPILADIRSSGAAVLQGLAANDTYSFVVVWVDKTGNQSSASDTFRVSTINAVPFVDPATDGVNIAHALDGTEWLMKKNIKVTFEFSSSPMDASSVVLKWNVGGAAGAGQSRTIPMQARAWNPLVYDGVIAAENDQIVTDGCMVQYALWADGIKFDNAGVDFKFRVDATPPQGLTGVNVIDNGATLTAVWSPVGDADFGTYKIRIRPGLSSVWTVFDKSNKPTLGTAGTSSLTFNVNEWGHYYVNVGVVDQGGHEAWQATDKIIKRGAAMDPVVTAQIPRMIPAVAGQPVTLTVKLWDLNGAGWSGQPVMFAISGENCGVGAVGTASQTVTSGSDGSASVTVWAMNPNADYKVAASSAAAPGFSSLFYIRTLASEQLKNQTDVYDFEAQ